MKKLYLVDVSSMFFRAFYAIPPLKTSQGLPTNALYGFLAMSVKLLRENKPDYMVYCFDRKEPSFRSELYEEYKANRTEMPEELQPQIPYIKTLTERLGIATCEKEKFEADDVIGTLARLGESENLEVSIVSGDKDFAQLVGGKIALYDTMKNVRYDRQGVVEKWGVEPDQMIDYLAIVGDSSDNITGVHGVGPKGAQKLLAEFKTLDGIYENLDKIKSESLRTKLLDSKKSAFLARKLVTIVTEVPLDIKLADMQLRPIDKEKLKSLLDELEFGGFLRKLFNDGAEESASASKKAASANPGKKQQGPVTKAGSGVATGPTTPMMQHQWSLDELKKNIKPYEEIWAVLTERGFCLGHEEKAVQVNATLVEIGEVLESKKLNWKGFDLKSVWRALEIKEPLVPKWDTMLAAYVVKAGQVEDFSKVYTQYTGKTVPDLASPEDVLHCEIEIETVLRNRIAEMQGEKVYETLELPLVPVLYQMERTGILLQPEELRQQSTVLTTDIQKLEKEIFALAGESFNIASPKQLGVILFDKLKVPVVKKTKTGYSTDSDVLSKLAPEYPICQFIQDYRELAKLKSTYVDSLPTLIDPKDGRLHTHFHQALTQTGRLSSSNPNLQNIPIRTDRGRAIRKAFVAKEGCVLLSVDYSQIELRILAQITGDPGLTAAFKNDLDIHAATAAEVFGVNHEDVTPEQRRMAKAINFGIAYGQGAYGLAESLDISQQEAKKIIESYFHKFKKVKEYMFETVAFAKEHGYVETALGRRRYIDEIKSSNNMLQKFGERAAINAPIQGASSDLMKLAMIRLYETVQFPMLLQVHDELLFECQADNVEENAQQVKEIMESVAKFDVPLKANVAWGLNWEDAHT